ncbi:metallophosphoesterase [Streptomyces sp. RKCA744]|uniref:metallophosphoesterase n=1 Tax=Streptomyces sp. RKCA744 TaxID=2959340 RepID=UPI00209DC95F|nr:metallophosphoesterase [Streptomyces sp. RKCA744]MCO8308973.1 metallophosphoesterase [Streptomyces sp. RKCA744]
MVVLYVLIALAVVGLLTGVHWYVWRRLVHDTTARGGRARRAGTAAAFALPLISVGALIAGRSGAPFALQRVLAWPGYLWLALLLYLTLALLAGEAVRPLLRVWLRRRAATGTRSTEAAGTRSSEAAGTRSSEAAGTRSSEAAGTRSAEPAAVRSAEDPAAVAGAVAAGQQPDAAPTAAGGPAGTATSNGDGGPTASGGVPGGSPVGSAAGSAMESAAGSAMGSAAESAGGSVALAGLAEPARGHSRRLFIARTVAAGATAVAAGTVGYGTYSVLRGPRLKRITVPLAKLPRRAHGFRIAVVSDIHLGPILGRAHTQRIVETINRTSPDLVAVVGDLVDGSVADLGPAAEPLRGLRARHGSYFVTGNHEYYSGADQWVDHVRELGLRPLENERTELAGFDLAGVNDISGEDEGHGPDYGKALGDRDPSRASVLLAHQPVMIHEAVKAGVDLQLSGHTHGGQLWPGTYVAELANPTAAGLERYGDTQLYVTRGAGAWGPPVRVGAPPDVTVVELASTRA